MSPNSQAEQTINHFSHPHPLHLSNIPNNPHFFKSSSCSGCKLNLPTTTPVYTCPSCNYFLHIKCSQMPPQITHPFHKQHVFSLSPTPLYQQGYFDCDACGKQGHGFSYHCKPCNLDLHILCASLPLSINHVSHFHPLVLAFSPPYAGKMFNCDVCHTQGSNHWLYRCNTCGFDAHLNCATKEEFLQPGITVSRSAPQVNTQANSWPQQTATGFPVQNLMMNQGVQRPFTMNNESMVILQRLRQQFANSSAHNDYYRGYLQALVAGGAAGTGVGGLGRGVGGLGGRIGGLGGGLGGIGGGGGLGGGDLGGIVGGGGVPFGNGIGSQNLLQSVLGGLGGGGGGSGGVGVEALQALLGGAGGGLDVLGGILGGLGGGLGGG